MVYCKFTLPLLLLSLSFETAMSFSEHVTRGIVSSFMTKSTRSKVAVRPRLHSSTKTESISTNGSTATTTSSDSNTETSPSTRNFSNFDYESCWFPVVWAEDLKLSKPTKVTVFDTDYVIAKVPSNKSLSASDYKNMDMNDSKNVMIVAMEDRCPHKLAALSEGRVTSSGYFQCAYHGKSSLFFNFF